MPTTSHLDLAEIQQRIHPDLWAARVAAANAEAEVLTVILERVRAGESRRAAIEDVCPDQPHRSILTRLRRFEMEGRDALIDRRAPDPKPRKDTPEIRAAVRALAHARPDLGSAALADELHAALNIRLGGSTMRIILADLGLQRARGRPEGRVTLARVEAQEITELPLAGAELLKGTELQLGAVRSLTQAVGNHLEALPAPTGEVLDDRENRDEKGRFQADYNKPKPRTSPELGAKFETVKARRAHKDLRATRTANNSEEARYRKDLALMMLPLVVESSRWSELAHWRGVWLDELVGYAFQPATLDKYLRELKLCGVAEAARHATADFWMDREGDGSAIVYMDASIKPLWTHHFTRSTKVSGTGRVMPAMSTVWLHSGSGTPLLYRTFSGHSSLPRQVVGFLREVQEAVGEGVTRRIVVLDRESHAVWLFKELDAEGWQYIIPLRTSVTGPNAEFSDLGPWLPYGDAGDEVREGWLVLNDSRPGEPAMRHRVVARRRHRTGKVAWYATNAASDEMDPVTTIDRYFARWPLQEHVFRDGNGRVGLNVTHGYGKQQITHVAVMDRLETLSNTLARYEAQLKATTTQIATHEGQRQEYAEAHRMMSEGLKDLREQVDEQVERGRAGTSEFADDYAALRNFQRWESEILEHVELQEEALRTLQAKRQTLELRQTKAQAEQAARQERTEIFTADTELDEIMTAYKLTFMNLCRVLLRDHMQERMQLDTLIKSVLTLPGRRVRTKTEERVQIYRQPRDPRAMEAVERACASLNALGLEREVGRRRLKVIYELVDKDSLGGSR